MQYHADIDDDGPVQSLLSNVAFASATRIAANNDPPCYDRFSISLHWLAAVLLLA